MMGAGGGGRCFHAGILALLPATVLNANDMAGSRRSLLYSAPMMPDPAQDATACPDPYTRAPRSHCREGDAPSTQWLRLPPASLQGALVALVGRDTRKLALTSAQRLSHFPASPMVTISWFHDLDIGQVGPAGWQPFGAQVLISGSATHPGVSWAPTTGRGYTACFEAGAAQALFGVDLAAIQDRFVPVEAAVGSEFAPLWKALLDSDEAGLLAVLEHHLAQRWQAVQGRPSAPPSLRQLGRNWVERLAWQAHQWRSVHSERHVERRIKSFSGRSIREWQSLVRTEGLFFAARDLHEAGQPIDWATLAQDQGFSDQAHMSRMTKRVTGFAPGEFAQRFVHDESLWMYRLWV